MKFGCCLNMVSTQPDGTGIEWIETLSAAGFDYAELPAAQMMALDEEAFGALCGKVKASGIPCETSNNFFPAFMRLTGPDADLSSILEYVRRTAARLQMLGVQFLVFGSGPAENVPDGFPREEGYRQVVQLLKEAAPIVRAHGITIVIEPLRRAECNLINTFAEGVQLARDVDEEAVKVLVDFYHLTEEAEPLQHLIDSGGEYLRHVHFANPAGRLIPSLRDETDYGPFIGALKEIGYDLRVSCEAYAAGSFPADITAAKRFFEERF